MIIKIKKYVATVAHYVEDESSGVITKVLEDVTVKGSRISLPTVMKQIPHGCKLIEHGYRDCAYEIDTDALEAFLRENGEVVAKEVENA